jgi:curved DNA-binding protein CbpA
MGGQKFDVNKDYYKELGVEEGASVDELERAFRDKARRMHPDRGDSEEAMKSLNEAHDILSDPETRRAYDAGRKPYKGDGSNQAAQSISHGYDPYTASRSGTLGIPVSDPDFAGLVMGAIACFGLGLPLLVLVEMQWVFLLWPLRVMSLCALGVGVYLASSALALKQRRLKAGNPAYPRTWLAMQRFLFWAVAILFLGTVVFVLYLT